MVFIRTLLVLLFFVCISNCATVFKFAAIYSGPVSDRGYNYYAELGRVSVEQRLFSDGIDVVSEFRDNVNAENAVAVASEFGERGFDFVALTSFTFNSAFPILSRKYPNTYWQGMVGFTNQTLNAVSAGTRTYAAHYINGALCGLVTKSNKVCYMTPKSELASNVQQMNAFFLGSRLTNPDTTFAAVKLDDFLTPLAAKRGAELLADKGCDCLSAQHDSPDYNKVFASRGLYSVGYISDSRYEIGETILTSIITKWDEILYPMTKSIINGTFETDYGGKVMRFYSSIGFAPFSTHVTAEMKHIILPLRDQIVVHANDTVFCGSLATSLRKDPSALPCLTASEINNRTIMNFFSETEIVADLSKDKVMVRQFVDYSSGLGISIIVVTVAMFLFCLIIAVDIFYWKETRIFKSASPNFCYGIIFGAALGLCSVFFWLGRPTDDICNARIWVGGLAFNITFSMLIVKNYRIMQIFKNTTLKIFAITNLDLLVKGLVPLMLVEIIILILWTTLEPYTAIESRTSVLLAENEVEIVCNPQGNSKVFSGIFFAYKAVLLLAGCIISYKTRGVISEYKESESIGFAIYNCIVIGVGVLILTGVVEASVFARVGIICFGIIIIVLATLSFIFIPKMWMIHIKGRTETSSSHSNTTRSKSFAASRKSSNKDDSKKSTSPKPVKKNDTKMKPQPKAESSTSSTPTPHEDASAPSDDSV